MITMETAQQWAAAIQADPRLTGWIEEAEAAYKLHIVRSEDREWSAKVGNGNALISMAVTERPLPSFAHEILHVCLSARGYKHIVEIANEDEHKRDVLQAIAGSLDNELQHHRMFDEFVASGFDGGEFYHDGDDVSHNEVRQAVRELTPDQHPTAAFFPWLTLLAPGGSWPDDEREDLTQLLQANVSMDTWDKLQAIKDLIERWKQQASLDPTDTVAAIIETLGDFDNSFVSERNAYPVGAFIPQGLTQEEFEAHAKAAYEAQHGKQ
ncbi:hypothetical protein [Rhizobium sp. RU36D]|uniref:hypothetical protein n=1 Tax=Rhizobium sp. RU36D TaxID=1907415 RepID=UPI0009D90164|nr:hypothetical protein [Rhizobium sp. RU36D]SMD16430.1 hypothetical protein SAMN05880593_12988 [Rhizobium sp. RU36D]